MGESGVEEAVGRRDIQRVLGCSRAKFFRKRPELLKAGVIFYRLEGRPPVKRIRAFPSVLKAYQKEQAIAGKTL